ncbi:MAG: hypothetical protein IIC50_17570 [Planctomycetes bacterium]|nr:hypothetical protein [Planctomycetota bacterium]
MPEPDTTLAGYTAIVQAYELKVSVVGGHTAFGLFHITIAQEILTHSLK